MRVLKVVFVLLLFTLSESSAFGQTLLSGLLAPSFQSSNYESGTTVATSENYHLVSKPTVNFGDGRLAGLVEVYDADTNDFLFHIKQPEVNKELGGNGVFGGAMEVVEQTLYISALNNSSRGLVYVFDVSSGNPVWTDTISHPDGVVSFNQLGVRLVADGNRLFVAARYEILVYEIGTGLPSLDFRIQDPDASDDHELTTSFAVDGDVLVAKASYSGQPWNAFLYTFDVAGDTAFVIDEIPNANTEVGQGREFGSSLAIENGRLLVGDHEDNTVYLYAIDKGTHVLEDTIPIPRESGGEFGKHVRFLNDFAVIAADETFDPPDYNIGEVYVFDLSQQPAVLVDTIENPLQGHYDFFGKGFDLHGSKLVIGAPEALGGTTFVYEVSKNGIAVGHGTLENEVPIGGWFGRRLHADDEMLLARSSANDGTVFLYDITTGLPQYVGSLNDPPSHEGFGESMKKDGSRIVIGAPRDYSGIVDYKGAVYIYDLIDGQPVFIEKIWNPVGPFQGDLFGTSVESAGDFVFVGTPQNDRGQLTDVGSVYVYDVSSGTGVLTDTIEHNASTRDELLGNSLVYHNGWLYVGIPGRRHSSQFVTGSVRWFSIDENGQADYSSQNRLFPPDPSTSDDADFGSAMVRSGNTLVVTAPGSYDGVQNVGVVYVYDISNVTPVLQHTIFSPIADSRERFGSSVSFDGSKLVVGNFLDDSAGTNAGIAYVFDMTGETPSLEMTLHNPNPSNSDYFGSATAVGNGLVFVGAYQEDTVVRNDGRVYVYGDGALDILTPNTQEVYEGVLQQGGIADLSESDNEYVVASRNSQSVNARINFEVSGNSNFHYPSTIEITVESQVFARRTVTQKVLLYNYDSNSFEVVDSRVASRFSDEVASIIVSNNAGSFVDSSSGEVKARVEFVSDQRRSRFSARIDQVKWTLE